MNHSEKTELLAQYLRFLVEDQQLDIVVFDVSGLLTTQDEVGRILQPYMNHMNAYCHYVKSNQTLWSRCIILKERLMRRCSRNDDLFFGTCHCGVGEYVLPFRTRFGLSGLVSASGYRSAEPLVARCLPAAARHYQLDQAILRTLYLETMRPQPFDIRSIALHLSMVALLLNQAIESAWSKGQNTAMDSKRQSLRLIAKAMDYMNEMYATVSGIDEIAAYCNCSRSHLQHLFQAHRGRSVWNTLRAIRMEQASRLLLETDHPIGLLASLVGYSDANYFSTVFARACGLSPRRFRQMNRPE